MNDELLPDLPDTQMNYHDGVGFVPAFSAEQLRAYAREAIRQQWRPISEAPVCDHVSTRPEACLVYSQQIGTQVGRAWRYPDGDTDAHAFGFHGDWGITHWMPLPAPTAGEVA